MKSQDIENKINLWLKNKVINKSDYLFKEIHEKGFVYVLLLKNNKIYVGFTKEPNHRIKNHFYNKPKVSFLKKYPPVEVVIIIKDCEKKFEENLTSLLMKEFGWKNVRGGGYTQLNLPKPKFLI